MGIPIERVWAHEAWESGDDSILKGCNIWTHSADVGVYGTQTIPKAGNNGFPQPDNFCEPLLDADNLEALSQDNTLFNVDRFIQDIHKSSLDPNLMMSLLRGAPQSYMGPLSSWIHENYPMDDVTTSQFHVNIQKDSKNRRSKILRGVDALRREFPYHRVDPLGDVPKNSSAKRLLKQGLPAPKRPIQDASAEDPHGASINNCSSYLWMHRVELPKIEDFIGGILWMAQRCLDFGFDSHIGRIRGWTRDVKSAYRWLLLHPSDQWLAIFSIPDPSGEYLLFINDLVSAFGHRKAVSVWCRFAYAITTFTSQPLWAVDNFPQLALDYRSGNEFITEPPPAQSLDIDKFRSGPSAEHGCIDPLVGYFNYAYVDDALILTLCLHDDPFKEFSACSATGIRNPGGKSESAKFRDWLVTICTKKRKENGPRLSGLRTLVMIGYKLGLDTLCISLTSKYAEECLTCIAEFVRLNVRHQRPNVWNHLAGKLTRVVIVYPHTKCLMREIWVLSSLAERSQTSYRASHTIIMCLEQFVPLLMSNPGRHMRYDKVHRSTFIQGLDLSIVSDNAAHGLSDASSTTLALINIRSGQYYFRPWRTWELEWANSANSDKAKIVILEAIAAFYLHRIMFQHIHDSRLLLWGDHQGNTIAFNNGASGNTPVNSIIRLIALDLEPLNIFLFRDKNRISFNHCTTVEMKPYADALTRNRTDTFRNHMASTHPNTTISLLSDTHPVIFQANADLHKLFLSQTNKKRKASAPSHNQTSRKQHNQHR